MRGAAGGLPATIEVSTPFEVRPLPIIETQSLTRCFGHKTAVDNLTLSVESGEIFGLLGPNGAGKTTAIKMLTTLLPPTEGTARVAGHDIVREAAAVRAAIGYVPQLVSADGTITGYENLLIFSKLYDIPRREREDRVRGALALMGLGDAADHLVRDLFRRHDPAAGNRPVDAAPARVLFLDEPTVGLDPVARKAVWDHIAYLRRVRHD